MAWIESHDNIASHPKTRRAARMLSVSIPTMVGHLHLLWHWCLTYAEKGDLSGYDHADIADAMMWEGDPDQLVSALLDCGPGERSGFLSRSGDGRLMVHNWMRYAGALVQAREAARADGMRGSHERWHVRRGIVDPDCPYCMANEQGNGGAIGGLSQPHSEPESGFIAPNPT